MAIHNLFLACLTARLGVECPAVQKAIDAVAAEFAWDGDRKRALACLEAYPDDLLFNDIMNGAAHRSLKLATGMDREQWITLFERASRIKTPG